MALAGVQDSPNTWVELRREPVGARRGSAIRYAKDAGKFFLWGFMNDDPNLLQERPLMEIQEYAVVAFDPAPLSAFSVLPGGRATPLANGMGMPTGKRIHETKGIP